MKRDIVYSIPGGWYGSDPGFLADNPKLGVVVVDGENIAEALTWLKRRATVLATGVAPQGNGGIHIKYQLR